MMQMDDDHEAKRNSVVPWIIGMSRFWNGVGDQASRAAAVRGDLDIDRAQATTPHDPTEAGGGNHGNERAFRSR